MPSLLNHCHFILQSNSDIPQRVKNCVSMHPAMPLAFILFLDLLCPDDKHYSTGVLTTEICCEVLPVDVFSTYAEGCYCNEGVEDVEGVCKIQECPCMDSNHSIIDHGTYFNGTDCQLWLVFNITLSFGL